MITFALSDHLKDCMVTSSRLRTMVLRHTYSWLRALLMKLTLCHCSSDRVVHSSGFDITGSWPSNSFTYCQINREHWNVHSRQNIILVP